VKATLCHGNLRREMFSLKKTRFEPRSRSIEEIDMNRRGQLKPRPLFFPLKGKYLRSCKDEFKLIY